MGGRVRRKVAFPPRGSGVGHGTQGVPARARPPPPVPPPCARQPVRASPPRRWRPERRQGTSGSRRAPGACLALNPRPRHTDVNRSARPARAARALRRQAAQRESWAAARAGGGRGWRVGAGLRHPAGAGAQRPPSFPFRQPCLPSCSDASVPTHPLPPASAGSRVELALAFPILGKTNSS